MIVFGMPNVWTMRLSKNSTIRALEIDLYRDPCMLVRCRWANFANDIYGQSFEWPWLCDWMQSLSWYSLYRVVDLTLDASPCILNAIFQNGRLIVVVSSNQPSHFDARQMSPTNSFVRLAHYCKSILGIET